MSEFLVSGADLFTLANIIMIDLVLAGDNAVVVGMAASKVDPTIRKKVIAYGLGGAVLIRVFLASIATYMLTIIGLTLAGGLLLLWVCWQMYREASLVQAPVMAGATSEIPEPDAGFRSALIKIILADLSMSLDNVLAVAGAARGNLTLLAIGLGVVVLAMAIAANYIANLLERFPWIMWVGLLIILYVAVKMISRGGVEIACNTLTNIDCSIGPIGLMRASFGL